MPSALSASLAELHHLLQKLEEVEKTLADGPRRIAVGEKQLQAAKDAVEAQKTEIRNRKKAADEINLRLRSKESELLKLQGVLNQAASNKEYSIVKSQSESGTAEKLAMEDQALAALDASDTAQKKIKDFEAAVKVSEQALAAVRAEVQNSEAGLRSELQQIEQRVSEAESKIDWGQHLQTYQRMKLARRSGALAAVESKFCEACNNSVTSQDMVRMNTGHVITCRECGRLIYVIADISE